MCKIFVHKRLPLWRLLGVSLMATLLQCLILLLPIGGIRLKLFGGFGGIMAFSTWLLFRPIGGKRYWKTLTASCMAGLTLGGSLELLEAFLSLPRLSFMNVTGLTLLSGLFIRYVVGRLWRRKRGNDVSVRLLFSNGSRLTLKALIDSGNSLREPISGEPVSLVNRETLNKEEGGLLPDYYRLVPYHSIGCAKGLIPAYRIEGLEIELEGEWKKIESPFVGAVEEAISIGGEYQMILHPALLED
ncbi:MAG: sigma-E processing peptidase SpoIIGA [Lachnospiraceae bacterium]|nr:sigma-E processing peptidase SpoIIGA [Lachnospiraceae bacterium]